MPSWPKPPRLSSTLLSAGTADEAESQRRSARNPTYLTRSGVGLRAELAIQLANSRIARANRTASQILSFFFGLLLGSHNKDIVASRVRCRR